jgi:hypothetical protein
MQRLMAQGAGGAPGAPTPPGAGASLPNAGQQTPSGSPTPQPQEKKGLKAAARSNLVIAQNMAEQALTAFQPEDAEYKACLKVLNTLAPILGKNDASDLVPAQVMRMVGQLPQMGGGSDIQRMILKQMQQPPGAPPGAPGAGGPPPGQQPPQMPQG